MTGSSTKTGLAGIATSQATFAIVAMDQRNTLKRMYHAVGIPDPSDDELVQIFGRIASGADFSPADGCVDELRNILATTVRSDGFGNARFIRNLFESAVVRQAWRVR